MDANLTVVPGKRVLLEPVALRIRKLGSVDVRIQMGRLLLGVILAHEVMSRRKFEIIDSCLRDKPNPPGHKQNSRFDQRFSDVYPISAFQSHPLNQIMKFSPWQ